MALGVLGATTRLTRLITDDKITEGLRRWAVRRWGEQSLVAYLLFCPWCVSPYVAATVGVPTTLWGMNSLAWHVRLVLLALIIPTASYVAGYLLTREE